MHAQQQCEQRSHKGNESVCENESNAARQWLQTLASVHQLKVHVPSELRSIESKLAQPGALQSAPAALATRIRCAIASARATVSASASATVAAVGRSGTGKSALLNRVLHECVLDSSSELPENCAPTSSDNRWYEPSSCSSSMSDFGDDATDVPYLRIPGFDPHRWSSASSIPTLQQQTSHRGVQDFEEYRHCEHCTSSASCIDASEEALARHEQRKFDATMSKHSVHASKRGFYNFFHSGNAVVCSHNNAQAGTTASGASTSHVHMHTSGQCDVHAATAASDGCEHHTTTIFPSHALPPQSTTTISDTTATLPMHSAMVDATTTAAEHAIETPGTDILPLKRKREEQQKADEAPAVTTMADDMQTPYDNCVNVQSSTCECNGTDDEKSDTSPRERSDSSFLLPEGSKLDTTSVGYTVRLGRRARARIEYCSTAKASRHLAFLRAVRHSWNELERDEVEQPLFRRAMQTALAMCGMSPYTELAQMDKPGCGALPKEMKARIEHALVYEPSGNDANTLVSKLARFLEDETVGTSSHWGLVEQVDIEIPAKEEWVGFELVDSPGAGEGDTARAGHLQNALFRADTVLLVCDARPLDGDVVQTLRDCGFMAQERPGDQSVIVASLCDKAIGRTANRSAFGGINAQHNYHSDVEYSWRPSALAALKAFEFRLYELRLREIADCAAEATGRVCDTANDVSLLDDCLEQLPLYPTWTSQEPIPGADTNINRLVSQLHYSFKRSDLFKRARGVVRARRALMRCYEICSAASNVVKSSDHAVKALQRELVDVSKTVLREEKLKRSKLRENVQEQCKMVVQQELDAFSQALQKQLSSAKREHCNYEAALQRMQSAIDSEDNWLARPLQLALRRQVATLGELMDDIAWPQCRSQLAYILAAPLLEGLSNSENNSILAESADAICERLSRAACVAPAIKAAETWNLSDSACALLQWSVEDVSTDAMLADIAEAIKAGRKRSLEKLSTIVGERIETELASCLSATASSYYIEHPSLNRDEQRARVEWRLRWLCVQASSITAQSLHDTNNMARQAASEMVNAASSKHLELLRKGADNAARAEPFDVRAMFASCQPFDDADMLQRSVATLSPSATPFG